MNYRSEAEACLALPCLMSQRSSTFNSTHLDTIPCFASLRIFHSLLHNVTVASHSSSSSGRRLILSETASRPTRTGHPRLALLTDPSTRCNMGRTMRTARKGPRLSERDLDQAEVLPTGEVFSLPASIKRELGMLDGDRRRVDFDALR